MSEDFDVKGPHDKVLEGEEVASNFDKRVAVMTAIMATLGALFSYQAGLTLGEAIIQKNESAIRKTAASDQWNYYQAKGNKQTIAELAALLTSGRVHDMQEDEASRYSSEKNEILKKANEIEKLSKASDERSESFMHAHHFWATGATGMQIAISLSAIALLTQRRWLVNMSLACAGCGIILAALAMLGI